MKSMIALVLVLLGTSVVSANCLGEAQVILQVSRESDMLTYCRAVIRQVEMYNPSMVCPLALDTVLAQGIDFAMSGGHDCDIPNEISGVLVLTKSGCVILE